MAKRRAQAAGASAADPALIAAPGGPLEGDTRLDALYNSPEFLIRRAHQVASATFTQACADLGITTSQYAVLFALRQHADVGQNAIGRLVSLDRSTTSLVVRTLKDRKLVTVAFAARDRRKTFLELTDEGRMLLASAETRSARSVQALLSVFDPRQANDFLVMLQRFSEPRGGG